MRVGVPCWTISVWFRSSAAWSGARRRGGRDSIDHPVGGHDDLANSAAGALLLVGQRAPMKINPLALQKSRQMIPRHVY